MSIFIPDENPFVAPFPNAVAVGVVKSEVSHSYWSILYIAKLHLRVNTK